MFLWEESKAKGEKGAIAKQGEGSLWNYRIYLNVRRPSQRKKRGRYIDFDIALQFATSNYDNVRNDINIRM